MWVGVYRWNGTQKCMEQNKLNENSFSVFWGVTTKDHDGIPVHRTDNFNGNAHCPLSWLPSRKKKGREKRCYRRAVLHPIGPDEKHRTEASCCAASCCAASCCGCAASCCDYGLDLLEIVHKKTRERETSHDFLIWFVFFVFWYCDIQKNWFTIGKLAITDSHYGRLFLWHIDGWLFLSDLW